ncbi:LPS export ABC transporter permease LptF [Sphaerotilus sp.]|jgi:lipopolysaccharide export system permease protein|uniref:LPS export ABC transporter permease LptF n=1 Tax=Sphaerotilus sp. TaxID=2093942 RepID=UPI0025EC41BE|nr:LPS export ABC transporter permease LptF [Sphaerotilus sp.]
MLFDSTLRKALSRSFGGTLVVILTIVLTMMLIRVLGMAAGGEVSPQDVVLLLGYTALGHLPTMLSLSLFISVVSTLTRMYRDSEMAVWFSSGLSLWRFVRPVLRFAAPVLVAVVGLMLVVWPWSNRNTVDLRARYEQRSDLSRVAPGQFQSSGDGSRVFFLDKQSSDSATGHHIFILDQREGRESVTTAQAGRIEPASDTGRRLVLEHGARTDLNLTGGTRTVSRFDRYEIRIGEQALAHLQERPPKALDTLALLASPDLRAQGELVWRAGMVLGAFNLLLWGIGLASGGPRGGNNWVLLVALLGFVVYFNLINLSQAWVGNGKLDAASALVLLHGGLLLGALGLLRWRTR